MLFWLAMREGGWSWGLGFGVGIGGEDVGVGWVDIGLGGVKSLGGNMNGWMSGAVREKRVWGLGSLE